MKEITKMNSHLSNQALKNYRDAFEILSNSQKNVDKSWYMDISKKGNTTGLIWHFTDINNMANILSFSKIGSKNYCRTNNLSVNDNASTLVNESLTKKWVHDYARFYLRPKTPTQYRNEGIFGETGEKNKRLLRNGELWVKRPAHLPVPIFITFSLKHFLELGGFVTKRSLAGSSISENFIDEIDKDLSSLKQNITDIYDNYNSKNYIKQTEFIMKDYLKFSPGDIKKIYVRTEIEKLSLLTMLSEHNAKLFSKKEQHEEIDIDKYKDKIVVKPDLFFHDAGMLVTKKNVQPTSHTMYPKCLIKVENNDKINKPSTYTYTKKWNSGKSKGVSNVTVNNLKRTEVFVNDINNEKKLVGVFHDPDWILDVNKWSKGDNNRYYSKIYHNNKYFTIYRKVGENDWYCKGKDDQPIDFLKPEEKEILKQVEESYSIKDIES